MIRGRGEVRRAPSTRLLYWLIQEKYTYRNWLNKRGSNYRDLIPGFLGMRSRLCRRTTFPRLCSITKGQTKNPLLVCMPEIARRPMSLPSHIASTSTPAEYFSLARMHLQELGFLAQATEKKEWFWGDISNPILAITPWFYFLPMPKSISGGLKRKLALAAVLGRQP